MSTSTIRSNFALLLFYVREKYWHHAEELCTTTITATDDWIFRVWRGLCYDQQGMPNEALREYKAACVKRHATIPALMGMLLIYKRNRDQEGISATELKLQDEKHAEDIDGWTQAAALAWVAGDVIAAREVLLKLPESQLDTHEDDYTNLATIRGWVDLNTGRPALLPKCGALFQKVMDMNREALDLNAAMGRVAYLERQFQFAPAQDLLNRLVVSAPNFLPALVVKARLLMLAEDWDQALNSTRRILARDKKNVEAIALEAIHALVKDARPESANMHLNALWQTVQVSEPRNAPLMFQFAQAFSRLSGRELHLLNITAQFADAAASLDGRNGDYLCEVGYHQVYRGDYKTALTTFQKATALTESLAPLLGSVQACIQMGKFEEAAKHVELCNELQPTSQRSAEHHLLNATIFWRLHKNEARSIACLDLAAEAARQEVQGQVNNGLELYAKLNLPVTLEIARAYMQHGHNEPPDASLRHSDPISDKCRRHLELILGYVPGCMAAQLLLSRIRFVSGDINGAQVTIRQCLQHEQPLPEAYLLSAQICQYMGNVKLASQALEQALTLDFEVKDQPRYNLLHGIILSLMGKHAQALESLQLALSIVKNNDRVTAKGFQIEPLGVMDMVTLYLQLAQTYLHQRDVDEAHKLLAEAALQFRETTQAGRVLIAQAMLMARTDPDKAVDLLSHVPPTSEYYIPACTQMGKLYLVQRHNAGKYIACLEEMVQKKPCPQSYVELGEAYTTVQEHEKAIVAYEKARALGPDHSDLAVRIGRSLVSTHDYQRAVQYYNDALRADASIFSVRADLAMLYYHLGDVAKAMETLEAAPMYEEVTNQDSPKEAVERVNCSLLVAKIWRGAGDETAAAKALLRARTYQIHLLESCLRNETRETMLQQKQVMATIATALGTYYVTHAEPARAQECFAEALRFDETHEPAMLCLARMDLENEKVEAEACEERCNALLKSNPSCDEAVMLLAELTVLRRPDRLEDAKRYFEQLIERKRSGHCEVLVQYIQLLRQTGHLDEVEGAIEKAVAASPAGQRIDPGLRYAQGLAFHYNNANADALRHFNMARLPSDNPWSERALVKMIEIYLVPTTVDVWADDWVVDEKHENIRCAEQLLLLLPIGDTRRVLEAYCLLSSKKTEQVEQAMHLFLSIIRGNSQRHLSPASNPSTEAKATKEAGDDEDDLLLQEMNAEATTEDAATLAEALQTDHIHLPAFLGLAVTLYLSKQETAARNVLGRLFTVSTPTQRHEESDVVTRATLLLAHMDTRAHRLEDAQLALQSLLTSSNPSCSAAWDMMGMIYEQQHLHKEASESYEKAWQLVKASDPAVGYKLAFNYLKGNLLVKAIDVSRKVLSHYPDYPRIEEDVMNQAYSLLRP